MASLGSLPKESSPSTGWRGVYTVLGVHVGVGPAPNDSTTASRSDLEPRGAQTHIKEVPK
jgi:hypothetical protein